MKKFLKKVIVYFLATALLCFLPSIIVDPFSVFHPLHARANGIEPNKNYIKTNYVLHNPDKFDSFILGSSHASVMNPYKLPGKTYNMYYSGGVPAENLETLKTFIRHGIIPKNVYIGIDNISLDYSYEEHTAENLRAQYEYSVRHPLKFWMMYLDPVVNIVRAGDVIKSAGNGIFNPIEDEFYLSGAVLSYQGGPTDSGSRPEVRESYNEMLSWLNECEDYPEYSANSNSIVSSVSELRKLCNEYGINLIVMMNPMYYAEFKDAVENDALLSLLRQLAEVTPYYNFCGYNKYTTDIGYYFSDFDHYSANLADITIDCFQNGMVEEEALSQGFGMYVTSDNVEEFIATITAPNAVW